VGRIPRGDRENLFRVIGKATVVQVQVGDTAQTEFVICDQSIEVAQRTQETLGHTLAAVRLDSGDILGDSLYIREQLDAAGLTSARIIASGDLDEWKILDLL